jgi:hypothetical protein
MSKIELKDDSELPSEDGNISLNEDNLKDEHEHDIDENNNGEGYKSIYDVDYEETPTEILVEEMPKSIYESANAGEQKTNAEIELSAETYTYSTSDKKVLAS